MEHLSTVIDILILHDFRLWYEIESWFEILSNNHFSGTLARLLEKRKILGHKTLD